MKLRLPIVVTILFALGYALPGAVAQTEGKGDPSADTKTTASNDTPAPAPPTVQPADPDKVKHDGGRTDVDAVGNRNVGCARGLGNWYSVEKQIAMGKSYAMQV